MLKRVPSFRYVYRKAVFAECPPLRVGTAGKSAQVKVGATTARGVVDVLEAV
jgi:hypothetical protein